MAYTGTHVYLEQAPLYDGAWPADDVMSGLFFEGEVGEDITAFQTVYQKSDGKLYKSDMDAASTMPVVGMAKANVSKGNIGAFLLMGWVRNNSWTWTAPNKLYASGTAGGMTATCPSGVGDVVQIVAQAFTSGIILFNPQAMGFVKSFVIPFVGGSVQVATGFDVDAESEEAYAYGAIPDECQEVQWIKVRGRCITGDGAKKLACDIDINGGADDEAYNTEAYSANDVLCDTATLASDDVITWTVTNAGVVGSGGLSAGDSFNVLMTGAPANGTYLATDVHFQSIEIAYI